MVTSKLRVLKIIGPPVISSVATFVLLMLSAGLVSGLPRPMQGEEVSLPWPGCVLGAVALALFPPWLVSLPFLKDSRMRMYFFLCLAAATATWYFLGFEGLMSKAYRRG